MIDKPKLGKMKLGLQTKFLAYIISGIILMACLFSGYYIYNSHRFLTRELENKAKFIAHNLGYNSKYGVLTKNKDILFNLLAGAFQEEDVSSVVIYDMKGTVLVSRHKNKKNKMVFTLEEFSKLDFKYGQHTVYLREREPPLFTIIIPVKVGGVDKLTPDDKLLELENSKASVLSAKARRTEATVGYVQITISLQKLVSEKNAVLTAIFWLTLLVIAIVVILSVWFVRLMTRPILDMSRTAMNVAQGDLSLRVSKYSQDEIGALADAFNQMVDSLCERNAEIHQLNQNLEQKVKKRTEQLETANAQLQEERDKAQKYFDIAGVMLAVINPDETVLLINKKGSEILGYEENEIIGKNWFDNFIPQRMRTRMRIYFNKLIKEGPELRKNYEHSIINKNKQERIISWDNTVLKDDKGGIIAAIISGEDITERKQAEEVLKKTHLVLEKRVKERTAELAKINEELQIEVLERKRADEALKARQAEIEELNASLEKRVREELKKSRQKDIIMMDQSRLAAMGEMIGLIAHQWRQPLNALNILLYNIKDLYDYNELEAEVLEDLTRKGTGLVEKMSATIDDFRDFFRPGKTSGEFKVNKIIADTISLLDPSLRYNNISVVVNQGDGAAIQGVSNKYSQVMLNILNNAKDAIVANGIDGKVTIDISSDNENVTVKIRDNGGGIPENMLDDLFTPYVTSKGEKGTGLGLYLSKVIIEEHMKGHISARNINGGAEFTVVTPKA